MKLQDLFLIFPMAWIYSDCFERICKWLGMSNGGQDGYWRSAVICGIIFFSKTVEEVECIFAHHPAPGQKQLLLTNCCWMLIQSVLINLYKGDFYKLPSQPVPAVSPVVSI